MTRRPRTKVRASSRAAERVAAKPANSIATLWPFLVITFAAAVAYANAPGHPFLFDDRSAIVENATIRSLTDSLRGGPAQSPTAGRPLVNFTFALNYAVGGVSPWGYQAFNLLIHIACALLLFAFLRRTLRLPLAASLAEGEASTGIAAATALLWVVHPLTSEVVDYATQRTESLMALSFLATLYCGVRGLTDARPFRWNVLSVLACAAGMTCKESMVTAPALMLLLDATFMRRSPADALRSRAVYYLALFATWVVLAVLLIEAPRWRSAGFSSGVSPWSYLLNQASMIVRYLRLVFVPTGLVADYGEPVTRTVADVWPAAAFVLILLVGTLAAWRVSPLLAFFATWFFITLAPTSSVVPIATEVGAERRMYLPLVAVLAVLAVGAVHAINRLGERVQPVIARGVVVAACLVLIALTLVRNAEYATTLGIWETVVARWPSGRGHYNYGLALKEVGRRAEALEEYRRALPDSPGAHYALGFELQADGRYDEAIEHYREFIRIKPLDIDVPRAYHQIGRALLARGEREEALVAFKESVARNPADQGSLAGIGDTLLALDRLPEAATAYQNYLRRFPRSPEAMMNLGLTLVKLDRDAEARDQFAEVTRLVPDNVAAHVNLAYTLANTGNYNDSIREFRRALELEKDRAARADIEAAIAELLGH